MTKSEWELGGCLPITKVMTLGGSNPLISLSYFPS